MFISREELLVGMKGYLDRRASAEETDSDPWKAVMMRNDSEKCAHCGEELDDVFSSCPICGEPLCDDCSEGNCPNET